MSQMTSGLAAQLVLWADQLRDIAARGLMFSANLYDLENYRTVQTIALHLLAAATGEAAETLEPLRAPIFSRPTPLCTGDAAIVNEAGQMLLIQRADNAHWAMPGGVLDVGETPAEGVAREALEETGVRCEPVRLVGVYDSRRRGTISRHHLYQFVFLCRPLAAPPVPRPSHDHEVLALGWFDESTLPTPLDPGHALPIRHAFAAWRGERVSYFDQLEG